MGGFALYDKKEGINRPIHPDTFPIGVQAKFALPTITEEEINDKSKGDGLTKTIAVFQLLWFSVQLISRLVKGWAATELEVLTFATCILTVAIYFFWWNKPLDVHCQTVLKPIPDEENVDGNDSVTPEESRKHSLSQHNFNHRALISFIQHRLSESSSSSSSSRRIQPRAIGFIAGYSSTPLPRHFFSRLWSFLFCFFGRRPGLFCPGDLIARIQSL